MFVVVTFICLNMQSGKCVDVQSVLGDSYADMTECFDIADELNFRVQTRDGWFRHATTSCWWPLDGQEYPDKEDEVKWFNQLCNYDIGYTEIVTCGILPVWPKGEPRPRSRWDFLPISPAQGGIVTNSRPIYMGAYPTVER